MLLVMIWIMMWAPEANLLQVEGVLDDSSRGHSHPQDVLLCAHVVWLSYPVYVRQVAKGCIINISKPVCFQMRKCIDQL